MPPRLGEGSDAHTEAQLAGEGAAGRGRGRALLSLGHRQLESRDRVNSLRIKNSNWEKWNGFFCPLIV